MPVRKPTRRTTKQSSPTQAGFSLGAVFSGLIYALIFAVVVFMLWSLVFTVTKLPDKYMAYAAYSTSFLAALLGGRRAAKRSGGTGWLHGGIMGLLYSAVLLFVAMFAFSTPLGRGLAGWARPTADLVAAIIGGIWGANTR